MQTGKDVWAELRAGNERFASGAAAGPHRDRARLDELVGGQHPRAAVIACSDSRVPVELLFDAGFGDIFTIRTAGGCVDDAVVASVDFAVSALGVPLVVVMSHESCGAIGAAIGAVRSGEVPGGLSRVFVEKIGPSVIEAGDQDRAGVEEAHARITAEQLIGRIPAIAERGAGVVAARYRLDGGRVETVWERFAD